MGVGVELEWEWEYHGREGGVMTFGSVTLSWGVGTTFRMQSASTVHHNRPCSRAL